VDQEILGVFVDLAKSGEKVMLYNTYKSLPICFDAEFVKISRGTLTLRVHKYQALCIKKSGYTLIRHALLPKPVYASTISVDFMQMVVVVTDFQALTSSAGNRRVIRVEPEKPFSVFLSNSSVANADAIDISAFGLGLTIKKEWYIPQAFGQDKLIGLEFRHPNEKRLVTKMKGVITNVVEDYSGGSFRLGIHTYPDAKAQQMIADYVLKRQVEILKELETLHRLLQRKLIP
jgi:hypothetical protein